MEGIKCMDTEKKEFAYREDAIWKGTSGIVFRQSEIRTSAKEDLILKPVFFYKKVLDLYFEGKKTCIQRKIWVWRLRKVKLIAFLEIFPLSEFREKDRNRSDCFSLETSRTTLAFDLDPDGEIKTVKTEKNVVFESRPRSKLLALFLQCLEDQKFDGTIKTE